MESESIFHNMVTKWSHVIRNFAEISKIFQSAKKITVLETKIKQQRFLNLTTQIKGTIFYLKIDVSAKPEV